MPADIERRLVRGLSIGCRCTYRKGCQSKATWYYVIPYVNRWGYCRGRWRNCCNDCALFIKGKNPGIPERLM